MKEEELIREELERLARAHNISEHADGMEEDDSTMVEVSAEIAETLRYAVDAKITGLGQEMTAIVSVAPTTPIPAEWLYRLAKPAVTKTALESILGLQHGCLQSVKAIRTASDDSPATDTEFVFVTEAMKTTIEQSSGEAGSTMPFFVHVTKAGINT